MAKGHLGHSEQVGCHLNTQWCPRTPHPTQMSRWRNSTTITTLVNGRCGPGTEVWVESLPHRQAHPTSPPLHEHRASKCALPVPMAITRAQGTCLERQASFSKGGRVAGMIHYTGTLPCEGSQVPTKQEEHCVPVGVPSPQSRGALAGWGLNSRATFQGDARTVLSPHTPHPSISIVHIQAEVSSYNLGGGTASRLILCSLVVAVNAPKTPIFVTGPPACLLPAPAGPGPAGLLSVSWDSLPAQAETPLLS